MSELIKIIIIPFWRRVFQLRSHCTRSSLLQLIIYRNVIFFPSLIPSVWRIFLYSRLMSLLPYIILVLIFSQNIKFFIHTLTRCLIIFPLYSFIKLRQITRLLLELWPKTQSAFFLFLQQMVRWMVSLLHLTNPHT